MLHSEALWPRFLRGPARSKQNRVALGALSKAWLLLRAALAPAAGSQVVGCLAPDVRPRMSASATLCSHLPGLCAPRGLRHSPSPQAHGCPVTPLPRAGFDLPGGGACAAGLSPAGPGWVMSGPPQPPTLQLGKGQTGRGGTVSRRTLGAASGLLQPLPLSWLVGQPEDGHVGEGGSPSWDPLLPHLPSLASTPR